jgi:aerobic carbon-monoxide dehydrogenase small subunit
MRVACTVNGEPRVAEDVWEGESLLYVLRERLGLPGSKNACEQGECGSCSVYLDGMLVCACLVAAGQVQGAEIVTVEGLGGAGELGSHGRASGAAPGGERLHPVQAAFVEAGAVQCGFCTPGLVVATHDLLRRDPVPSDARIREALAGNLCRCTGYQKILDAVHLAADRMRQERWPGVSGPAIQGQEPVHPPERSGPGRPDPAAEEGWP